MNDDDATDSYGPQEIGVYDAPTADVGGCNFCPSRPKTVTVITSPSGLRVRFCARCIGAIGAHRVGSRHPRPSRRK